MRSRPLHADLLAYLDSAETMRPYELAYGMVREPAAPYYDHQLVVTRLAALLDRHVRPRGLGRVAVAPVDVVLDSERALVVQPDLVFVSTPRLGIIRNQIWGAPDLVVEVLSMGTAWRDRRIKVAWYRRYGVRESWLVDPIARTVEVFGDGSADRHLTFADRQMVRSTVLAHLRLRAERVFEDTAISRR